jgi:hypothetical protein
MHVREFFMILVQLDLTVFRVEIDVKTMQKVRQVETPGMMRVVLTKHRGLCND